MPNQEPLIKITPREAVEKIKAWFADHTLPKLCDYRDADGCKCAIGVLIPDDIYVKYISPYAARPGLRVGHLSHVIGEANRVNPRRERCALRRRHHRLPARRADRA